MVLFAPVDEVHPHFFGVFEVEFPCSEESKQIGIFPLFIELALVVAFDNTFEFFECG